ncbi:MAG: hypothetical protein VX738_02215 [Planctomycetota bacterium]|nr:hypothetical protein [Planctomycetota bacterium]
MVERIDFKEDLKQVISLPWLKIWMAGFATGLMVALLSLVVELPGILEEGILDLINDGDLLSGEDPKHIFLGTVLVFLLISVMTSFVLTAFVLINGSKTVQFLFVWSLVLSGYFALIFFSLSMVGIVVLSVCSALFEGEWGLLMLAAVCVYPAYLSVKAGYYCIVKIPKVSDWIYKSLAKTG